jgi:voltage-gated potassium channel
VPTGIYTAELAGTMLRERGRDNRGCVICGHEGHELKAHYCNRCGHELPEPLDP